MNRAFKTRPCTSWPRPATHKLHSAAITLPEEPGLGSFDMTSFLAAKERKERKKIGSVCFFFQDSRSFVIHPNGRVSLSGMLSIKDEVGRALRTRDRRMERDGYQAEL
jgi:hypothetical protein